MSIGDKILDVLGWPKNADISQTPLPEITRNSSTWGDFFTTVPGLPVVSEKSLLSISAAFACVNLIAGAISAIPLRLYRQSPDNEREELATDDLWWILNEQFIPRWSAANAWEYLVQSLLFHGDAFAVIIRQGARVVGLEPIHPTNVTVMVTPDRMRLVYVISRENGGVEVFDQDDMIHVAGFGFDGFRGVSPIKHMLSVSGSVALATQEYSARFFANSARPDIIISTDQIINQETADRVSNQWLSKYGGLSNSHKPAVMGHGFKAVPLTMTSEDAELLATRQFQIEEIARAFGVPPHLIGHTDKATSFGAGIESMGVGFVRFALRQHLHKFETEINRKLFRRAGKFTEFDTFELERADMKTLFESFRVAVGRAGEPGFMTTDEVRTRLNLKRTPSGDTLTTGAQDAPQQTA